MADLVNNLLTLDQALPVFGAQYIAKDGRRCAIAVSPTVSRERVKDGRWIGQGEELNAAVIWTRAEQPAAPAVPDGFALVPLRRLKNARVLVDRGFWTEGSKILDELIAAPPALAAAPRAPAAPSLPTVRLVGVKAGTETDLGEMPMPPSMRARELLRDYGFTDLSDDMSQDASALGACEELIAYCQAYFATVAAPAGPAMDTVRQAVRDYHYALDTRKHGGIAASNAIHAIEAALGMEWNQGAEAAARAPQAKEGAAP